MSSMNKEIMNILKKLFELGPKYIRQNDSAPYKELVKYGAQILDKERYRDLETLLAKII